MRKWFVILGALMLFGAGVALILPRTGHENPVVDSDPTSNPGSELPQFHEVSVTSGQQDSPLAITGRVVDQRGTPVPNAKVSLSSSAQQDLSTTHCDVCERPLLSCENGESWLKVSALLHQAR